MAVAGSLQLSHNMGLCKNQEYRKQYKSMLRNGGKIPLLSTMPSSCVSFQKRNSWCIRLSENLYKSICPVSHRSNAFRCHAFVVPGQSFQIPAMKAASMALTRSYNALQSSPVILKLSPAVAVIIFAIWGLGPLMRHSRNLLLNNDNSWKKSGTYYVTTSYLQPLLLWTGATLVCRVLDPLVLPTEASQVVKQRLLNFVRSLSTVLAFAYCLSSMIQQAQKFFIELHEPSDTRNMGFQFAGKAVYSAVWVAAVSLFMELLGFSTQKWLTAGGLGTVLLTLAGREIFTNFLSSAMIHATRPFVVNEWIQTKIEGYEVSGTVEHVGWWSPTIIRGEDREAVHIPNHKFTVNVVRNLSQKTHWRIKTHLAISHLDVHKIHNIVADMRKVLAKNSQVEQQRLHRRVFLEKINPENQALTILISCFVKTSHHEEYLCVKEAILLDLLRVISHHRARLATPIRTVQKIYSDADLENVPFAETIFHHGGAANRPLLLIEPSYRINGDDKAKSQNRQGRGAGDQENKATSKSSTDIKTEGSPKSDSKTKDASKSDIKGDAKSGETPISDAKENIKGATGSTSDLNVVDKSSAKSSSGSVPKSASFSESSSSESRAAGSVSDNVLQSKKIPDSKPPRSTSSGNARQNSHLDNPSMSSSDGQPSGAEKKSNAQPSVSRPSLEENIVLGVALEGSKRTLPIEEDMAPRPTLNEIKEMAAAGRNGNASSNGEKDEKDGQTQKPSSATSGDQLKK
ncbi:mechanosensitive ion channel protein 2, chloroplastic isoform X2 [Mercurialis annua]|uniref:mechanosensitive ion channel protein 2, chloroplastic isoform X2 n=1 Tax=Mercurialis annua TaxID=3986 RepID=UPI00215EC7BE|nr:mechanosensitive ion channel protein 2, chloroplastic isoform X2 [Mercurialis annua]